MRNVYRFATVFEPFCAGIEGSGGSGGSAGQVRGYFLVFVPNY
eukprot:SAG31_NODE_244_length_19246_cov_20.233823_2_plen_43_part_00